VSLGIVQMLLEKAGPISKLSSLNMIFSFQKVTTSAGEFSS
jgi:hypothetical protein